MRDRKREPAGGRRRSRTDSTDAGGQGLRRVITPRQRASARIAFIRALAHQTAAIDELRVWQLSDSARSSQSQEDLGVFVRDVVAGDAAGISHEDVAVHETLRRVSGRDLDGRVRHLPDEERRAKVIAWAKQWNLDTGWAKTWAYYALIRWDVARQCSAAECPSQCSVVTKGDAPALGLVVTESAMTVVVESHPQYLDIFGVKGLPERSDQTTKSLPAWQRQLVEPIDIHPLYPDETGENDTEEKAVERTRRAWREAVALLHAEGISLAPPRKLEAFCSWLVRYQVLRQTVREIAVEDGKDDTTIYNGIRTLAHLIDVPRRS
jgi:hypothetical protein